MSPLNPLLYARLKTIFKSVIIANEGVAAKVKYSRGVFDNKIKIEMESSGEYYRVRCIFCGDQRHRLWINHLFGVPDEVTGNRKLWLSVCYNENCFAGETNRAEQLYDMIYGFQNANNRTEQIIILPGDTEAETLQETILPGQVISFSKMPATDPVYKYLHARGYDPKQLSEEYDISYCLSADNNFRMAQGRIVIPVYMRGNLVGWQCRYPAELDWKELGIPKYYTKPGMPKRLILYNYDNAVKHPFVIVTEGPMDAWNIAPYGVSLFGKKPSAMQLQLLCESWPSAIIILLDGDAWDDANALVEKLKSANYRGLILPIKLPANKDPADLDKEYILDTIKAQAIKENVDLTKLRRQDDTSKTEVLNRYRSPSCGTK